MSFDKILDLTLECILIFIIYLGVYNKPCMRPSAPTKLHVRARFFTFARKFNGDLCMAAPHVQVRTKRRRLRCPDQPDPRTDPNPTPNPNPTLWGARGLRPALESRSTGAVLRSRANLKTLHVRAIKSLVCAPTQSNVLDANTLIPPRYLYDDFGPRLGFWSCCDLPPGKSVYNTTIDISSST